VIWTRLPPGGKCSLLFISKRKGRLKLVIFLAKKKEVNFQRTSLVPIQHKDLGISNVIFFLFVQDILLSLYLMKKGSYAVKRILGMYFFLSSKFKIVT
jgi:hypothetical protein